MLWRRLPMAEVVLQGDGEERMAIFSASGEHLIRQRGTQRLRRNRASKARGALSAGRQLKGRSMTTTPKIW
jgi:hypothetical protein